MTIPTVLLPVFVQVFLTFFLLVWMARARIAALQGGQARIPDVALRQQAWPERATVVGNAFHNQLELPVLFYVLVALALHTRKVDLLFVAMSWAFVASRLAHAYVFVTTNRVPLRFRAFAVGALILLVMWIVFALRILFTGVAI